MTASAGPRRVGASGGDGKVTAAALRDLSRAMAWAAEQLQGLSARASALAEDCAGSEPLSAVMAAEERPLIVTQITRLLDQLADAGAAVRRAEAQQLRAEGLTQEQIAAVFGVSRQRAGALLAPPPAVHARAAKRPRVDDASG